MRAILVTKDDELRTMAERATPPIMVCPEWTEALDQVADASDLIVLDLLAALDPPHRIAGYEKFAEAKMGHPRATSCRTILIGPPEGYELDFMVGWPGFLYAFYDRGRVSQGLLARLPVA